VGLICSKKSASLARGTSTRPTSIIRSFFKTLIIIGIHGLVSPLVAEEAIKPTLVTEWAGAKKLDWLPVELDEDYRNKLQMDLGYSGIHPIEFTLMREWIWFVRIMRKQVKHCILVCGLSHATGIARKFHDLGVTTAFEIFSPAKLIDYHVGNGRGIKIRCAHCREMVNANEMAWVVGAYYQLKAVCKPCEALIDIAQTDRGNSSKRSRAPL
jgi:hypothetical protein